LDFRPMFLPKLFSFGLLGHDLAKENAEKA